MSMAPQSDPIVGATVLRIPAIQSPNFVTGSAGWIIRTDGSVEFNNGTFRGSITSGTNPGKHLIINNPATGDALDVYNSSNNLVYSIDANGAATSFDSTGLIFSQAAGGRLTVQSASDETSMVQGNAAGPSGHAGMILTAIPHTGAIGEWDFLSGSADGSSGATLFGTERAVRGSVMQTDALGVNNLVHAASYTGTTEAGGGITLAHGASFTPKGAVVTGNAPGLFANLTFGVDNGAFTSTNFRTNWHVANTGAAFATSTITFYAILWG